MAGILDGLVKGLANLAPQDDPEIKMYNAQNELKELNEKEEAIFAKLGRKLYEENGKEAYPDEAVQLDALAANRAEVEARIAQMQAEKEERERIAAEERAAREAAEALRTCPNCGTVNPEGTKFCGDCGTKLPDKAESGKRFCTQCGAEIGVGMKFCGECGAKQAD